MTATKLDRRSARTRQACLDAFLELLLSEGYEAISVSDVIARADVGRSTFYDHYTGKEDLLRACLSVPFSTLADCLLPGASAAELTPRIAHFHQQRRLVRDLLSGQTRGMLVRCLAEMIEANLPKGDSPIPAGLAAAMLAESQLGLLWHWLSGRDAVAPERIAAALVASGRAAAIAFQA
jgi:AcrR family transcriptional regulator